MHRYSEKSPNWLNEHETDDNFLFFKTGQEFLDFTYERIIVNEL